MPTQHILVTVLISIQCTFCCVNVHACYDCNVKVCLVLTWPAVRAPSWWHCVQTSCSAPSPTCCSPSPGSWGSCCCGPSYWPGGCPPRRP